MLRHPWKRAGRAPELWDLACDAAVESILDALDYPCLDGGTVPAKEKFYGECRGEMPVLTAEGIYRRLLRLDLAPYEIARLQRVFLADDHGLWDPAGQDEEQQRQREQKWQGVSERTQTGLEDGAGGPGRRRPGGAGADPGGRPGRRGLPGLPPAVRRAPGGHGGGRRRL